MLKKWLGQMIEALVFVHGKKVIHRDLKPSNIFMTSSLDIALGDFGVARWVFGVFSSRFPITRPNAVVR